jgi:glutaredoxin-like protein
MPLLSVQDQQTLQHSLAAMKEPVTIRFVTQSIGCETCFETERILREITSLTDKVAVEDVNLVLDRDQAEAYGIDRAPGLALLVGEARTDTRIRFMGAPEGWDFFALVDAILLVSGAGTETLSDATTARLAALTEPVTMRVFVTPTCPHCPKAAALANRMAFASLQVTAFTVQATEFIDLARQYRVSGVPKTVVSNGQEILGALPEAQFVAQALGSDTGPTDHVPA